MSSLPHGARTSKSEVTNISANGLWILAGGVEHFLSFEEFPWFKDAPVGKILNVMVRRIAPVAGSMRWNLRSQDCILNSIGGSLAHARDCPVAPRRPSL